VGALTDDHVYHSLLRELEEAQREILLWMLATSPQISAVPVLQDRARAGVKVRLLLGSEQAVASLRGGSSAAMARTAIEGWKANTKGFEHMDLRLSDAPEDAYLAGSMLIDDTLLRIDVYDPLHERGMDGVMLEARSPTTLDLNLVWLYRESFEAAGTGGCVLHAGADSRGGSNVRGGSGWPEPQPVWPSHPSEAPGARLCTGLPRQVSRWA
jgi:hypothetical protein